MQGVVLLRPPSETNDFLPSVHSITGIYLSVGTTPGAVCACLLQEGQVLALFSVFITSLLPGHDVGP